MSQSTRILELFRSDSERKLSCGSAAQSGLYHSLAKRVFDLRGLGHDIRFFDSLIWSEAYYKLVYDKDLDPEPRPLFSTDENGQMLWLDKQITSTMLNIDNQLKKAEVYD